LLDQRRDASHHFLGKNRRTPSVSQWIWFCEMTPLSRNSPNPPVVPHCSRLTKTSHSPESSHLGTRTNREAVTRTETTVLRTSGQLRYRPCSARRASIRFAPSRAEACVKPIPI
jgi:hypothetical protein